MKHALWTQSLDLASIRSQLDKTPALMQEPSRLTQAAVALLLRGDAPFEIFFIIRASHDDDPWSGDIGFPGGKIETDESPRQTAERETFEEVGICLKQAELLGGLEPIRGAHLPVEIHCLVYHLKESPVIRCNHEIAGSFWLKIPDLLSEERFGNYPVRFKTERLIRPGVQILPKGAPVLWGITYRLLNQFFCTLGVPFPPVTDS